MAASTGTFLLCRQDQLAMRPYIRIEDAEAAVLRHYASLRLPDGFAARVREVLDATLADEERSVRLVHEHLTKRLTELDAKEENLLDLVEDGGSSGRQGACPTRGDRRGARPPQGRAGRPRAAARSGRGLIRGGTRPARRPAGAYRQTTDPVRRQLNQVFFDKLYLDADEVTDDLLAEPFNDFLYPQPEPAADGAHPRPQDTNDNGATWDAAGGISPGAALLERIARGEGSSKATMVELRGFEPLTSSMPWKRATNCAKAPCEFPRLRSGLIIGRRDREILARARRTHEIGSSSPTVATAL